MEPIFCVIDNPVALRYFAKGAPHLFALGRNATPDQVIRALEKDFNTEPIGCSEYRLAAWKNHWHFGISPVQAVQLDFHLPKGWCSEPRFNVRY